MSLGVWTAVFFSTLLTAGLYESNRAKQSLQVLHCFLASFPHSEHQVLNCLHTCNEPRCTIGCDALVRSALVIDFSVQTQWDMDQSLFRP